MSKPSTRKRPPRGCGYAKGRASRAPVVSARQRANLDNADNSTGPRTAAGKAASSGNALRHGLRARAPVPYAQVEAIAAALGDGAMAWVAAELQLMLMRIGKQKLALFEREEDVSKSLSALETLADYERKAWSLRRRAFRALEAQDEPFWPNEANPAPGLVP